MLQIRQCLRGADLRVVGIRDRRIVAKAQLVRDGEHGAVSIEVIRMAEPVLVRLPIVVCHGLYAQ